MQKRWLIKETYPEEFAKSFPEFSAITLQLLWDRGITSQELIDEFFNPDYKEDIHDPYLMKDMGKAVDRIIKAFENNERITVYGDYDVDGVTSSAIMVSSLVEMKSVANQIEKEEARKYIDVYIPNRELEGYGLNENAIKEIKNKKTGLIITVDCGISGFENVKKINELGMDVIITDHHHVPDKLPNAYAIINPRQKDCEYPFKELAGAGVAFKVAQAILKKLADYKANDLQTTSDDKSAEQANRKQISIGFEKWLLDLVALGTIADCVNLVGENRTLTAYGLLVINKTRRIGLKSLIEIAGMSVRENGNLVEKKNIDAMSISFVLAPRLNAAGRMDHANTSYGLLLSESEKEAKELAEKLEKNNKSRQSYTEKIISEIKERIEKYKIMPKVVVESEQEWKVGVVGLVAGKLTEEYSRPFLILQKRENECAGSGRSIPEFNLIEAIEKCKDLLLEFGGHSQAAGIKIKNSNLGKFKKRINEIADGLLKEEHLIPFLDIDCEIDHEKINWQVIDEIEKFKPFGQKNKKPVFLAKRFEVHEIRTVGSANNHLKLSLKTTLKDGTIKYISAIGFKLGKFAQEIGNNMPRLRWGDIVDVVFQMEVNEWNGNRELQMNLLDLKISK